MPKAVDTSVLVLFNERFIPASYQFGGNVGIAVTKALLQAEGNAQSGEHHAWSSNCRRRTKKVDREMLLDVVRE